MSDLVEMIQDEWLEADGLGGFASETVSGIRTRRYHALLLTATKPPAGRIVLVNGFDALVETEKSNHALSSQLYPPDVMHPDGAKRIIEFEREPWPKWIFALEDGTKIEQQIFALNGASLIALSWCLLKPATKAVLTVTPFLSCRDYHSMHHENSAFQFQPEINGATLAWRPYPGIPGIIALHNGEYRHQPDWYRNFVYAQERERGLDFTEDLAAPGKIRMDLSVGEGILIFAAEGFDDGALAQGQTAENLIADLRANGHKRRVSFATSLDHAADTYLVKRGNGKTIVAGYPWFTDWGRDTFIALRGLCLAAGRLDEARDILLEWAGAVSRGMLPNRFPDRGDEPEFNAVDASLWYVVAVHDYLAAALAAGRSPGAATQATLSRAVDAILTGYAEGTRFGIRAAEDGLLAAGEPGVQLTWMDARVGD